MQYEWDEAKRISNLNKHGVDFNSILRLFANSQAIHFIDDKKDYGEIRKILFGEVHQRLFQVSYTIRNDNIRIISARKASKKEKIIYDKLKQSKNN